MTESIPDFLPRLGAGGLLQFKAFDILLPFITIGSMSDVSRAWLLREIRVIAAGG